MLEYTAGVLLAMALVIAVELLWARTGIFRTARYWVALAIMVAFQVLVDGWLTKLSAPIVSYSPDQFSGVRFPWDIPIEDFGFGFALITATLILWEVLGRRESQAGA
ncbi:MAG: lycopene cyclase domain-containing protein [Propionicimonas sp.]|nr:lycopene cyclase domain-containing protein [Propionicimonas sp.]